MDRAVLLIYLIVGLSIVGLVLTADNEPRPTVIIDEPEKPHIVDTIPGERSIHNVTIIKNPDTILSAQK